MQTLPRCGIWAAERALVDLAASARFRYLGDDDACGGGDHIFKSNGGVGLGIIQGDGFFHGNREVALGSTRWTAHQDVAYSKMVHALPSGVGIAALSSLARAMSDGASRLGTVGGCCIYSVPLNRLAASDHWTMGPGIPKTEPDPAPPYFPAKQAIVILVPHVSDDSLER